MGVNACDDGNIISGDGCSPACSIETGFKSVFIRKDI